MVTPARRIWKALKCAALAVCLAAAAPLSSETVTSAEIFLNTLVFIDESGASSAAEGNSGGVRIGLDTSKAESVKGSVSLSVDAEGEVTLDKAYIKTRFPWVVRDTSLRFTAGKAPLAWGKGFLFNAGDPVFGAYPAVASPTNGAYRTAADWLAALYLPVGTFSFAELIYLPPVIPPSDDAQEAGDPPAANRHNRAGGRLFLTPGFALLQSIETGYLYEEGPAQSGYIAFDGSLFFDYYGAASVKAAGRGEREITVSAGLFRMFSFIPDVPLTIRLETLIDPVHGTQLWYPSVQASATDSIVLSLQGLFATGRADKIQAFPGLAALVCTWTPLKGFTLSGTLMKYAEKGDFTEKNAVLQFGLQYSF